MSRERPSDHAMWETCKVWGKCRSTGKSPSPPGKCKHWLHTGRRTTAATVGQSAAMHHFAACLDARCRFGPVVDHHWSASNLIEPNPEHNHLIAGTDFLDLKYDKVDGKEAWLLLAEWSYHQGSIWTSFAFIIIFERSAASRPISFFWSNTELRQLELMSTLRGYNGLGTAKNSNFAKKLIMKPRMKNP